jgi:adenine phosphoribosyltransferase
VTAAALNALIREVQDFPTPGIVFKDITPILADHSAFDGAVDLMLAPFSDAGVSKVAGIEARGFMFAAPIAARLGAGFIPIRKPGKLPCQVVEQEYDLEYGTDKLQVHADAVHQGERVLIVDDVLATGGTAAASLDLLRRVGADVVGFTVLLELEFLHGRQRIDGIPVHAVVRDGAD